MNTQTEKGIGTLSERLTEALENRKRQEAEQQRVRISRDQATLGKQIAKVLGVEYEPAFSQDGDRVVAEIEGLRFSFEQDEYGTRLVLLRECPHCHAIAQTSANSLDSIAAALDSGDLGWRHKDAYCLKQSQTPQTADEKLLYALREFIAENSHQG